MAGKQGSGFGVTKADLSFAQDLSGPHLGGLRLLLQSAAQELLVGRLVQGGQGGLGQLVAGGVRNLELFREKAKEKGKKNLHFFFFFFTSGPKVGCGVVSGSTCCADLLQ